MQKLSETIIQRNIIHGLEAVPFVSVVVVCYNEDRNISSCLDSLVSQDYPEGRFEIIAVDGGSSDKTQEIIKEFTQNHPNVKLFINAKRSISAGRNIGLNYAAYNLVAFIDADCIATKNWLALLVFKFLYYRNRNRQIAGFGGASHPWAEPESSFNVSVKLCAEVYSTGTGSVWAKGPHRAKIVANLPALNVIYDKKILQQIGGFRGEFKIGEDQDISMRLRKSGYFLQYAPRPFVWHILDFGLISWSGKNMAYGYWQGRLIRKYGLLIDAVYFIPLLFILSGIIAVSIQRNLFLLLLFIYLLIIVVQSLCLILSKKAKLRHLPYFLYIFIIQHFSYAISELFGLFLKRKDA